MRANCHLPDFAAPLMSFPYVPIRPTDSELGPFRF
jgi:hypothetical protein